MSIIFFFSRYNISITRYLFCNKQRTFSSLKLTLIQRNIHRQEFSRRKSDHVSWLIFATPTVRECCYAPFAVPAFVGSGKQLLFSLASRLLPQLPGKIGVALRGI